MRQDKLLNIPAIRRMPTYLHKLLKMQAEGKVSVSSTELAEYMKIELIVVRKDISEKVTVIVRCVRRGQLRM